jgi:hypothetical protein
MTAASNPPAMVRARRQAEQRILTGPQLQVRRRQCRLCSVPPLAPCQPSPRGDHLLRWLDAAADGRITAAELAGTLSLIIISTPREVVPDTAVRAAA